MTDSDNSPILVTGGTGTLGRLVVPRLQAAGRDLRVLSRNPRDDGQVAGDLSTGDGVAAALDGVEVVVHLAGSNKGDGVKARHLVEAAADVRHLVYISVVGADRVPQRSRLDRTMFGYFGSKHAAEQVVAGSGIPWTTLRATQFHDLTLKVAQGMTKLPVVPVPKAMRFQPVDAGEVADRLVELTLGEPAGLVADLAGPRAYGFDELIRSYLRAVGKRRPLLPLPLPGKAAAAVRAGAVLPLDGAVLGHRTWEDFLALTEWD